MNRTKRTQRILTILSSLCMLISCSCNSSPPAESADSTMNEDSSLKLINSDGKSDYCIIRGENASDKEIEAAKMLREKIEEIYGVRLPLYDDWVGNPQQTDGKEIVIGKANRNGLTEERSKLLHKDWLIGISENRLYLCGGSDSATETAVNVFIETYLVKNGVLELSAQDQRFYQHNYIIENLKINGKHITSESEFSIIYPDNAGFSIKAVAERLRLFLSDNLGINFAVTDETHARTKNAIRIGQMSNEPQAVTALRSSLGSYGYFAFENSGSLYISGADSITTVNGVDAFIRALPSLVDERKVLVFDGINRIDNEAYTAIDPTQRLDGPADVTVMVQGDQATGKTLDAVLDTINQWDFHMYWLGEKESNYYRENMPFVRYVQFMTATGGNADRDLFIDPSDTSVLDDYDFSQLIEACHNVVDQGLIPWIKTGNVPLKYTKDCGKIGNFGVNLYEPLDYDVYYRYIEAIAKALVEEFGLSEIQSWRWGVFTEYENRDWFTSTDQENAMVAYCKIYDYTTEALMSVLGREIYLSAHSMTAGDGLWDECKFIEHCANGINYCTGEMGSSLSALATSFYDNTPSNLNSRTLADCIELLRSTAESVGLTNLEYGVDEGRILFGNDNLELCSRVVGWTYQAGYDARIIKQMIDEDINYFATWLYTTGDSFSGLPTVSHHVASCYERMVGSASVLCSVESEGGVEYNAIPSYNADTNTFYLLGYAFEADMLNSGESQLTFQIELPMFEGKRINVTRYLIDDDANFFDEWRRDYDALHPNGVVAGWSIDSAQISVGFNPADYAAYAELHPTRGTTVLDTSVLTLDVMLRGNAVVFYEIELAE